MIDVGATVRAVRDISGWQDQVPAGSVGQVMEVESRREDDLQSITKVKFWCYPDEWVPVWDKEIEELTSCENQSEK